MINEINGEKNSPVKELISMAQRLLPLAKYNQPEQSIFQPVNQSND